jgi:hypothetical protein
MMCLSICAVAMHDPSSGFVVWVDASCHPGALFDGSEREKKASGYIFRMVNCSGIVLHFLLVQLLQ